MTWQEQEPGRVLIYRRMRALECVGCEAQRTEEAS